MTIAPSHEAFPQETTPEEALLLCLARTEPSNAARTHARAVVTAGVDWSQFVQLAVAHGVAPLAYHSLRRLAPERSGLVSEVAVQALRSHVLAQHRVGMKLSRALPDLLDRFAARGIEVFPFKGPVLARMAYGRPALRLFTDLDLLIHKDDALSAIALLNDAGFEEPYALQPDFDSHWTTYLPFHRPHGNANGYVRGDGVTVDLHWGLASRYFLFPMDPEELWARRAPVSLENGREAATLSLEDTLLHLCVHATKHHWERLTYACDIAELLRARPAVDWPQLLNTARRMRCGRMLMVGLHVAHTLLDAPVPPVLWERITARPVVESLSSTVKKLLFRNESDLRALLRRSAFQLRIRDRQRDGAGACYHEWRLALTPTDDDRAWMRLPRAFSFLYVLLRPLRLLSRATLPTESSAPGAP